MQLIPAEVIRKKREGQELSKEEIDFFISSYTSGVIPDYQMSALAMAIFFRGMTKPETLALVSALLHSGKTVSFKPSSTLKVDKHSTGGVGDKTSLILAPIVALAGVDVPMISGRGLGHTGGTLDKLESIPGFNHQLSLQQFHDMVVKEHLSFIGQTLEICPADKKIYALRDVTATVESLPLICASIMSKKLAEGIDGLVLDVKVGSGAFMKTPDKAEELARSLLSIAFGYQKKGLAFLTDMNQPLGRFAGNAIEVFECLEIMKGKTHRFYNDTRELSLKLAGAMIWVGGKATSLEEGEKIATQILESGKAYEKFYEICKIHGGNLDQLPKAQHHLEIQSADEGYVSQMNTDQIGMVGVGLRAGRRMSSDKIDPAAGIEFHAKIGDFVKKGDVLFTVFGSDPSLFSEAKIRLLSAVTFSLQKPTVPSLIKKLILEGN